MNSFVDNFWGLNDITTGYMALTNFMKRGRRECEDAIDYLRERIAIEEEYSKKLTKLAKTHDKKGGFGVELAEDELNTTLRAAWKQVRDSTEKIAAKHKQYAEETHIQIHQPMVNMKETHKKMVADACEKVELTQKEFSQMQQNVPKLKKSYETKCKEHDAAESELAGVQSSLAKNEKVVTKLQQRLTKLKKEIEQTDAAYKQGIERLDETRIKWEEETTNCFVLFEGIEGNRISKMKEFLDGLLRFEDKMVTTIQTEGLESAKVFIECIKPEVDVELFVSEKRTGYSRPGPTFYENYYTGLLKDAMFGVDLEHHLTSTGKKCPELLERCLPYIEEKGIRDEGIYRLSGRQAKVQQLKSQCDKKNYPNLEDADVYVNDIASLIKLYLRELPNPLCTFALYDDLIRISTLEDPQQKTNELKQCLARMPEGHRDTLTALVRHLKKVSKHSDENKMTIPNLSIVFAPGLIRSENEANSLKDFRHQSKILEEMITNSEVLFP